MHCLWINKPVSNLPPCASVPFLWTTHQILDIGSVSKYFKNYHQCDKSDNSQIHTVTVQDQPSRSIKVTNPTRTRSKRRMETTVSGTDNQDGRHVTQLSTPSPAKTIINLTRTSLWPIIYTPAQLHETISSALAHQWSFVWWIRLFTTCHTH